MVLTERKAKLWYYYLLQMWQDCFCYVALCIAQCARMARIMFLFIGILRLWIAFLIFYLWKCLNISCRYSFSVVWPWPILNTLPFLNIITTQGHSFTLFWYFFTFPLNCKVFCEWRISIEDWCSSPEVSISAKLTKWLLRDHWILSVQKSPRGTILAPGYFGTI